MSRFHEWTLAKLDKRFGLDQVIGDSMLKSWIGIPADISDFEKTVLIHLQGLLILNIDNWNEQEYALHFIGPVLSLVNFSGKKFNVFAQRHITGTLDGETMSGNPDGMIASGWREPEIPYFCFQEYKREKDPEGDPTGQCLAAMLVAQELNKHSQPVYGCYIVGRNWFFMMLKEREYAISRVYPATNDDVFDIFRILKALKQIINNIVEGISLNI